ncbi:LOW QUALITY PROTEIN: poly(ADP-ribose) polymerase family member 14-related sequence 1 [Eleginops maclovinus]|uniref:LOW QUALITY PROTEIN: poly(ADP-ribose) polymerase family member 14-related sequence 1 n=1 Tax=Eleginops maclovinus TaxID=56733 RepID=UPI0030807D81
MADAYSYALLVELEENNIPRLKIKLVKYFQSKKSNGGDCEVQYENGSRTAVLRFHREEDRQNVLKKERHQIHLEKGVVNMTVRLPEDETTKGAPSDECVQNDDDAGINIPSGPDEHTPAVEFQTEANTGADETADEEKCSTACVLEHFPEKLEKEYLEMLVENVLKDLPDYTSAIPRFTLEVFPQSAVVTFQSGKENTEFVRRCPQNKRFAMKGLSVRPLEVTKQVLVDDTQSFGEDFLRIYFENAGGDVENLVLNEAEQSATITFEDHKAVQKIMKKKHRIQDKEIRVFPFYNSLGKALYGKDKPSLKLPAAVSEPIDDAVWKYLNHDQSAAETIRIHLAKIFCNVNLDHSTVCLSPQPSLLQEKNAKAIVKEWRDTVKSSFAQALSKIKALKLLTDLEVWDESEKKIRQLLLHEDLVVVPDKATGILSVVGLVGAVNRLEPTLSDVVNKMANRAKRGKFSITEEMNVTQSIYHILCQNGIVDQVLQVYPDLQMSFKKGSPNLMATGLSDEIFAASKVIYAAMCALIRQNLKIDTFVLDLLKDGQQEELTNEFLTSNGINAAFQINANRVQLIAGSEKDLNDAEEHLGKLLISQYIDVEDSNVLKKPEWQNLVSQLENADNKSCMRIGINSTPQQVVVSGHKDTVERVSSEVEQFLMQNAQVEETVVVKANVIVEFMKKHDTCLEQLKDKVVVNFREKAVCLIGSRAIVAECMTVVQDLVSSLCFENVQVTMPGVKKFYKDNKELFVPTILRETGCLVQLVDDTSGAQRQVPKPVYQIQTPDGVEIAVCKADLCSYPVHAVVNASNSNLKHEGGLAKALLIAAGPQFQDECDKIISLKTQLMAGDCVITGAGGQLCCKKVIHAVSPIYDKAYPQKPSAQLKRAVKGSLELAEKHNLVSVALPAISRNQGFPLDVCANTIVRAVKDYCSDKYGDNTLKTIHLVNNDDSAVQAMVAAARQEFGNLLVSSSQQPLPFKTTSSPVKQAGSVALAPNCLGQVQTKEGLDITLMKGNIENATTEVTVNTVFENLALNRGAVSNAIFGAAGPQLQVLVNAKNNNGTFGEVIVTDGCQLKSKSVFHAVTPPWGNGADKILSVIFKECLAKAEKMGLTSISFPAIGTGNLGFPKDLVASILLDTIDTFSRKKQPKHLKKVMIILYPLDAPTIKAFSDEFPKKFPSATGVPVPSSPQSTGPFSKVVSSPGMYETKMGSVVVQAVTGDISKETTDVIVNSSNDDFSLKSGVSKAILDAAGQAVEAECQTLGAKPHTGMIITQPGNLKSKKILHLVGKTDPVQINKVVKDALQMCMTGSYTSVSLPAIGTGQGNAKARQVADAMLDAVIEVLSQNTNGPLKTVRIVIFQQPMLKEFSNSMHHREATAPKDKSWIWNPFDKIKSLFVGGSDENPQKEEDFDIEEVKVDPVSFHICGESQAKVNSAKQRVKDLISKDQGSICIKDDDILHLSKANHQRIVVIQQTTGVSIRINRQQAQASLTIEGLSQDVLNASQEINEMLKSMRNEEELKKKLELVASVADWQYQQTGHQFQSFDLMANFKLEEAMEKKQPNVKVTVQGQEYTVTMPKGPATDKQGLTLQIKRIDKLKGEDDIPAVWDPMPANSASVAITLNAGSPEHTEVLNLFKATCPRNIVKIERIQNPGLWKSLEIKKRDMELRNKHQNNERRLFHGTCVETAAYINEHGFNRSYAGKNATCYGNGTYFAVNASYSASNTYSRPDAKGEKRMYLCRVLTGDFTIGNQGMITTPAKGNVSLQKYDSVVDNTGKPSMFVIFHDSQAYPEYMITFV